MKVEGFDEVGLRVSEWWCLQYPVMACCSKALLDEAS